jgi:uncharacterized protein (DUF433 family)
VLESASIRVREEEIMAARKRKDYGQFIVADPEICHGQLTFKGTRIFVKDVLYYVAKGKDWDWISAECFGRVGRDAIAEAVQLATAALLEKTERRPRAEIEKRRRAA